MTAAFEHFLLVFSLEVTHVGRNVLFEKTQKLICVDGYNLYKYFLS